jgi:hypothetical protein
MVSLAFTKYVNEFLSRDYDMSTVDALLNSDDDRTCTLEVKIAKSEWDRVPLHGRVYYERQARGRTGLSGYLAFAREYRSTIDNTVVFSKQAKVIGAAWARLPERGQLDF